MIGSGMGLGAGKNSADEGQKKSCEAREDSFASQLFLFALPHKGECGIDYLAVSGAAAGMLLITMSITLLITSSVISTHFAALVSSSISTLSTRTSL